LSFFKLPNHTSVINLHLKSPCAKSLHVSKMNKKELVATYDKFGIDEFELLDHRRDENGEVLGLDILSFARENFDKRASPNKRQVPTAKHLRQYLSQFLKRRPELIPTQTQQILDAEGFSNLFTPPLEPRSQPIERLWGTVKHVVAAQYTVGRTVEQTREQLMAAFYTHQYEHNGADNRGISPRQCAGMVRQSQEWMAEFVANNTDYLSGPLNNLMCEKGLRQRPADLEEMHLLRDRRIIDREWTLESAEDYNTSELLALNVLGTNMNLNAVDRIDMTDAMDDDEDDIKIPSRPAPATSDPELLLEQSMYPLRMHPGFQCNSQLSVRSLLFQ